LGRNRPLGKSLKIRAQGESEETTHKKEKKKRRSMTAGEGERGASKRNQRRRKGTPNLLYRNQNQRG